MADRYCVATGNWNSTSVWSATSGGTSGASVPTSSDTVYLDKNYTITLTANATVTQLTHTNGTLTLATYKLSLYNFYSSGSTTRTLNLSSGTLDITSGIFSLGGTNLTVNAGTSLIKIFRAGSTGVFYGQSHTFNDVSMLLGSSSNSVTMLLTGSPTFRLLDIRSANSEAHTVNFDEEAIIDVDKFIVLGASSSNRLKMTSTVGLDPTMIRLPDNYRASSYGQYVDMYNVHTDFSSLQPHYIGNNSVMTGDSTGWLLSNPPKISTLIDPLTTTPASNTNWTVSGTVTQVTSGHDGGGYKYDTYKANIVSTDTFDLVDSEIIFEQISTASDQYTFGGVGYGDVSSPLNPDDPTMFIGVTWAYTNLAWASIRISGGLVYDESVPLTRPGRYFFKTSLYSNLLKLEYSEDASSWSTLVFKTLSSDELPLMRSARVISLNDNDYLYGIIGSINPTLAPASNGNFLAFF